MVSNMGWAQLDGFLRIRVGLTHKNMSNSQSAGYLGSWESTSFWGDQVDWAISLLSPRRVVQASHGSSSPQEQQEGKALCTGVLQVSARYCLFDQGKSRCKEERDSS